MNAAIAIASRELRDRSRSARIALDVAFLAMTLFATAALFRPLLRVGRETLR